MTLIHQRVGNLVSIPVSRPHGFTIIEVVLVLAVAALIFVVVFAALPALQRSQRDTQRKQDIGRFMSQLTTYQTNNGSNMPSSYAAGSNFVTNYLTNNQSFKDPSTGSDYVITTPTPTPTAATPTSGQLFVYISANCVGTNSSGVAALATTNNKVVAVVVFQEQGGVACRSNQ
jgi:prepilin-type N-terminal cleavage/methylation domain-containing protein